MTKEYKVEDVIEFLHESNAIERVYDKESLDKARQAWNFLVKQNELTVGAILKIHKMLMMTSCLKPNEKGYYRIVPVYIGGREGIEFEKINDAMNQWVMNVNDIIKNGKKESKIFLDGIIKRQHIEFEKIHPFVDGNGRMGRIIMNWQRMKAKLPILIIHEGSEQHEYYNWFH